MRGGVPVCWPWFGVLPDKSTHGFVRTRLWQVRGTARDTTGGVVLRLGIGDDESTHLAWDHAFDVELEVTVGPTLTMALTTRNTGAAAFGITQALHTYFCVGDITQTRVQGLDGCDYLDKVQDFAKKQQVGAVQMTGETDRIYLDTTSDCVIEDAAWGRSICIAKQGSQSSVGESGSARKKFCRHGHRRIPGHAVCRDLQRRARPGHPGSRSNTHAGCEHQDPVNRLFASPKVTGW